MEESRKGNKRNTWEAKGKVKGCGATSMEI